MYQEENNIIKNFSTMMHGIAKLHLEILQRFLSGVCACVHACLVTSERTYLTRFFSPPLKNFICEFWTLSRRSRRIMRSTSSNLTDRGSCCGNRKNAV